MDNVAVFVPTVDLDKIRLDLYTEVLQGDRTGKSLVEQGFSRDDIKACMKLLVEQGLVFKYGVGSNTYFTVTEREGDDTPYARKPTIVEVPVSFKENPALALRMGYTDIAPPTKDIVADKRVLTSVRFVKELARRTKSW
jgi:hypothetical protein